MQHDEADLDAAGAAEPRARPTGDAGAARWGTSPSGYGTLASAVDEDSPALAAAPDAREVPRALQVLAFAVGLGLGCLLVLPFTGSPFGPRAATPAVDVARAVEEGYRLLDTDPRAAARRFREVLEADPHHATATLGMGQAALAVGDEELGTGWLCVVATTTGVPGATARGILEDRALGCP